LRQRFGRLNRSGRPITPVAAILAHREDFGPKADDPVYGDRIGRTWEAMQGVSTPNGTVDFGIEAFPAMLMDRAAALVSPKPCAPIALPAYAHLWSQTSPVPNADPEIGLFLHGPTRLPASVQVVWRADLSAANLEDRDYVLEILKRLPPRPAEAIEIPLWIARAWLRDEMESLDRLSDASESAPDALEASQGKRAFRYLGTDDERSRAIWPADIRPGDLIIVPATQEYGGCRVRSRHPGCQLMASSSICGSSSSAAILRASVVLPAPEVPTTTIRIRPPPGFDRQTLTGPAQRGG
jgi:CRISPR-associated endonuclease/helicase Cas3